MKVKEFDGSTLKTVLAAMIYDSTTCNRIASQWSNTGLFNLSWADLIGSWCVNHANKYGNPPGNNIVRIYEDWADTTTADDEVIESIEKFLRSISDVKLDSDSDYYLDVAGKLFNKIRIEAEVEKAKLDLDNGKVDAAQHRLINIQKVNLGKGSYVEPAAELDLWADSFSNKRIRPLVTYPGDLGKLIGDSFHRSALYSFMAPDKTGKTTWLIDLAYRAVRKRNRVVFFDTGDSTQEEVLSRIACRVTKKAEWSQKFNLPIDWTKDELKTKECQLELVDSIEGWNKFRKLCKSKDAFRLACYDNSSMSVNDLDSVLADWERAGWKPDVVVIDYADILAPPNGHKDSLDQIDETWKSLRRMSQRRNCLVVTATQSSASIYGKEDKLLGRQHFSGRKTKLAHVNGMIGINVTSDEKKRGVARINWIVRRRGRSNEKECVYVAGCAPICNPAILSKRAT